MKKELSKLSDEELVIAYRNGEEEAADVLVRKYMNLVRMKARDYYLVGGDQEDLIQEGMIALFKAIRDYNEDKAASFMTFASLCVSRQLRTTITAYNRKKNIPLNGYIPIDAPIDKEDGIEATLSEILPPETDNNPEVLILHNERVAMITDAMNNSLSKMEQQVLELYEEGLSYAEIAERLEKSPKTVDNAIQRIRAKLSKYK